MAEFWEGSPAYDLLRRLGVPVSEGPAHSSVILGGREQRAEVLLGGDDRFDRADSAGDRLVRACDDLPAVARCRDRPPESALPAGLEGERLQFEMLVLAPIALVIVACPVHQLAPAVAARLRQRLAPAKSGIAAGLRDE
jgi:hypothetical protein